MLVQKICLLDFYHFSWKVSHQLVLLLLRGGMVFVLWQLLRFFSLSFNSFTVLLKQEMIIVLELCDGGGKQ